MKHILLLSIFGWLLVQVQAQSKEQTPAAIQPSTTAVAAATNGPVAKFNTVVYEFNNLTQGVPGEAEFTVTNQGNEPLIIASATASCGCTNLIYPKEPILPSKSGVIKATYNAAALGPFIKSITVKTNADSQPVILQIKGKVNPKA